MNFDKLNIKFDLYQWNFVHSFWHFWYILSLQQKCSITFISVEFSYKKLLHLSSLRNFRSEVFYIFNIYATCSHQLYWMKNSQDMKTFDCRYNQIVQNYFIPFTLYRIRLIENCANSLIHFALGWFIELSCVLFNWLLHLNVSLFQP